MWYNDGDMKLLSVIIPAYNTELYLARCLDSLLYDTEAAKFLDIIVVNDGSKDNTLAMAQAYREKYPESIMVIDKENGGHGSTINAGLKVARGKYLKVLDSDDWVNIQDFGDFVRELKECEASILITNYQQDILYDSSVVRFDFYRGNDKPQEIKKIANLVNRDDFFFMFSMHSMTIRTEALKQVWGDGLLEKTFYVDQQYVIKALECAKDFQTLDYNIYRYFIGRPEQSVSAAGFYKHRQDHERVLRWMLNELGKPSIQEKPYLVTVATKQIEEMIKTHYEIYYQTFSAKDDEVAELFKFDEYLAGEFAKLHQKVAAAQNVRRRLSKLRRRIKQKLLVG